MAESEKIKNGATARLRNYFLAGVLVTAPISITFWLTWRVITFVDDRITPIIPPQWNPEYYLPFGVPGLGLIVALIALTLIGFLAAGYLGRMTMHIGERIVSRVPIVRSVYSWTKQVFETVLSKSSVAFREVVLIEYPRPGCWAVGFITGKTVGEVQRLTAATVYNVFVPATPNPTTGFLLFVPKADVHHLDLTVEEGIKLVISGGIVVPDHDGLEGAEGAEAAKAKVEAQAAAQFAAQGDEVSEAEPEPRKPRRRRRREAEAEPHRPGFILRLRNYFFAGILVTAPIAITAWLAWEFVTFVDSKVTPYIPYQWNPETYLPFSIPGLGVVIVVLGLIMIGFLTAGFVGRSLIAAGERLLARMPVIRSLYSAVKQILETVFKEQSKAFRDVILLEYPRKNCWAVGFITGPAESGIQELTPDDTVNVFLPTTPNPTSGFLLFLPRKETQILSMTVEEGLKMVVSGGIVTPPDPKSPAGEAALQEGAVPPLAKSG
ncbi:DUF502 domain-containing protein [Pelagibius marinus]|uniref:DUF502 domain-containing protein n=1 Tax=Pelagibius marinus TaxID=2762760 RepID=UPI0029CA7947|nr:DUF502 domain-containing protein [Pelagibius marinus]